MCASPLVRYNNLLFVVGYELAKLGQNSKTSNSATVYPELKKLTLKYFLAKGRHDLYRIYHLIFGYYSYVNIIISKFSRILVQFQSKN